MPYFSWPCESFAGLDLIQDQDELGWQGAVDLLNVSFDRLGRVRSRDGYWKFTTAPAASPYTLLGLAGTTVLATFGTSTAAINGNGVSVTTMANAMTSLPATLSTPGTTATYVPCGTGTTLQKYSAGSGFTAPTATVNGTAGVAMPKPVVAGVTPWDNRLVVGNTGATGGPNGAASSTEHLWFSDAGKPESWQTNNFVQLTPGENDGIQAIVPWRELLFVFKRRRFYVFTGTSTDSAGNPIFNYRTVDAGQGAEPGALGVGSAVAAPDGVYFSNSRGIWKTTGGPPVPVSQQINPLFGVGRLPPFYTGPTFIPATVVGTVTTAPWLAYFDNKIFAANNTNAPCVAVFDQIAGAWSVWDLPTKSLIGLTTTDQGNGFLCFSFATGTNDLGVMYQQAVWSVATDNGAAFTSHYQSGFNKFSYRSHYRYIGWGMEKTVRQAQLKGLGGPVLTWFRDFQTTAVPGSGNAVTLGTAPNVARGLERSAARGESLSFKFSNGASILDDFSTDTITAGKYAFDTGSGTIAVSGGVLVPSSTAEKRFTRIDFPVLDAQAAIQTTTGASVTSGSTAVILRWVDANNFLYGQLNFAGAASTVSIVKRVAGVDSTLATSSTFTTAAATSYWVRFACVAGVLWCLAFTADPATGATQITNAAANYTLTAAENAAIPKGLTGVRLIPQATDWRYDNLRIDPLGWLVDNIESQIKGERPVGEETAT